MTAAIRLVVERELSRLGPAWDGLFAGGAGLQTSRAWFAASAQAALPGGAEPHFLAVTADGEPIALFPMCAGPGRHWGSLTTPYTCIYQPLLRLDAPSHLTRAAVLEFARYCKRWPATRLEALDPDWPGVPVLRAGFAEVGLASRTFAHFGNWFETVPQGSWDAYRAARPGALRETIRRKTNAAQRAGDVRIEIARGGPRLGTALAAYEAVYARSWKEPEPFPDFNNALVAALAETGVLRIGVMWRAEQPVAAQYWSVVARCATVLKLAHDEEFKTLSPGTVLTAASIRELIEVDGVTELDFGRGDDAYKRAWAGERRLRIGLLALNWTSPNALRQLARHDLGRVLRAAQNLWKNVQAGRPA